MSVTATLVLWPKTAYCRQRQCICEIFHFASEPAEVTLLRTNLQFTAFWSKYPPGVHMYSQI